MDNRSQWHVHSNAAVRMNGSGSSIADEVQVTYYNNCGRQPRSEDTLRHKMAERVTSLLNQLPQDEFGMPCLPDDFESLLRKAKNWDDLQEVRRQSYVNSTDPDPMWKRLALQGKVTDAIQSHRILHGSSLAESRDVVNHYINNQNKGGDTSLNSVLERP